MATGGAEEASAQRILRISDIAKEPLEVLLPIAGYEKMPIVSLEEAVEKLVHLLPLIRTYAHVAKERCKTPAEGLTQDESASIMLYTMGWKPLDQCLYIVLNDALRSKDREKLTPWFLYLRLFLNALFRLPSIPRTVFRGVKLDLSEQYIKDNTIVWWGFSSCTVVIDVLQSELFLGKKDVRTMFTIECLNGKDIHKHSYFLSEDEILLLPATHFKVKGCLNQGNLNLIHLEETKPKFPLLQPLSLPSGPLISSPRIHINTKWKQNGVTIAGGNGKGNQLNQLYNPQGIYVDDDEQCIYVADCSNHRITAWKYGAKTGEVVAGGNGQGNQTNQLNCPTDVIVDNKNDSLIICDRGNRRVVRWSRQNPTKGQTIVSDIDCWGLTMDNNGDLYVSDTEKNEVRRWKAGETSGTIVAGGNGKGNHLNQLNDPRYIFVDEDHSVYVSDRRNHRVMKWVKGAKEGVVVAGGQGEGNNLAQLCFSQAVIVDHWGNVYVTDCSNDRIMRWSPGSSEGSIVVGGNGRGQEPNQAVKQAEDRLRALLELKYLEEKQRLTQELIAKKYAEYAERELTALDKMKTELTKENNQNIEVINQRHTREIAELNSKLKLTEERYRREFSSRARLESDFRLLQTDYKRFMDNSNVFHSDYMLKLCHIGEQIGDAKFEQVLDRILAESNIQPIPPKTLETQTPKSKYPFKPRDT